MTIAMPNNDEATDPLDSTLSKLPGYALRRAANAVMGDLSARMEKIGLRVSDASVIMILQDRTDITASDVGRALDIQRANMVPILNRLVLAGIIERKPLDRKSSALLLTAQGRKVLLKINILTAEFESALLARIPVEHRGHLLPALNALWK